jgi:hypothetical protein
VKAVAGQDLDSFSLRARGQNLFLLWDDFAAHRDEVVRSKAEEAHITLQFIPAGRTNQWQPMDLRISRSLETRTRGLFDTQGIRDGSGKLTVATTITLLLRAWDSITQEEVLHAWEKTIPLG